jgi:virginiamycin A acetyltransferase
MERVKNYIKRVVNTYIKKIINESNLANNILGPTIHDSAEISGSLLHGNIILAEGVRISNCVIAGNEISVGRYTCINGPNTTIYSEVNSISIGNFCSIARNVDIQEWNHPINKLATTMIGSMIFGEDIRNEMESKGPINIGHDVWIGAQAVILSGVTIGNGAVIGANAVVSSDIPPFAIAVGNPAKVIRYRFEEKRINEIMDLAWWNWEIHELINNKQLFF